MSKKELILTISALLIISLLAYYFITKPKIGSLGSTHEHADFMVYINGDALNFSKERYMVKDEHVHIENMIGHEIHKHATGITLGDFFRSLGFEFNENCFILDNRENYCNQEGKTLKFYVNGKQNYKYDKYEIKEGDKYLISYDNEGEEVIQKQLKEV